MHFSEMHCIFRQFNQLKVRAIYSRTCTIYYFCKRTAQLTNIVANTTIKNIISQMRA